MVMVINKKIKRTMNENKSQYIGSLALIIISCLLYTLLNQLSFNMSSLTDSFEKAYVLEDASFVTGSGLNSIPSLESKFNARIEECSTFDYAVSKDKTLRIFSENKKVNIPAIVDGKSLNADEILIDPAYAKANSLKIGDEIKFLDKSFKIAGFMALPNYIYPLKTDKDLISDPKSFGVAVITKDDFSSFGRGNSFYSVKFDQDKGSIDAQAAQFKGYLRNSGIILSQWSDISENKRVSFVTTKIQGIRDISASLPIAILLLTCVLTGIVVWRLLKREAVIIGTLYAQGYKKSEIKKHYMMYPLTVALTGGITGTILGALLLRPMLLYMVEYFNIPVSSIGFNPAYVVVSILLPALFLGISGYLVLNRQLVLSPVVLLRGGRDKNKINFIEHMLKLDKLKFSAKFKIREQLRSLSRLIFLLAGVILATMLLLLGFTAKSSMDSLLNESFRDTFKFKYEYVYNSLHSEQPPAGTEIFSASTFETKPDNKVDFTVCGISPDSKYIVLKDKSGTALAANRVIITRPLAEKLKAAPGNTVKLVNRMDSKEYAVTVSEIADSYIGEYIFMPISQFNDMLHLPSGSYMGLWSNAKLDIPEKALYSTQTVEESIKAFSASTQPLQATVGIISFMSFVIGLIVIYVVTSLIIEENKGSISLMKVFGYRRKEVNSLILNSSTIIIVIGYAAGIPFILATMSEFFKSLTENLDLTLPVTIKYPYIVVGFAVVYFTYELSKALCRRKINRIAMSEVLKAAME